MSLEQIKDEIRALGASERIELYRWLDYHLAADFRSNQSPTRIGAERALEIRRAIDQNCKITDFAPLPGSTSRASREVSKASRFTSSATAGT
jgi:hypothetical protein